MKNTLLFLIGSLFIITSFTPKEDYFEGIIVYEHKYETNDSNIDVEGFGVKYGTKSKFYFNDGNYKQVFNGTLLKSNLFINKGNKIYGQTSTSDTLFFTDCSQPIETIAASEILKNKDTVIDRSCNVLTVKTNDLSGKFYRNTFYYFNPITKIDPAWFKNVKYGNHEKIYALTNSLPLKIVNHLGDLTVTMTAVSVKKQKVDDKLFEITQGVITVPQK